MEIQSAFNAGVQGFQRATEDVNRAASDIAQSTAVSRAAQQDQQDLQNPQGLETEPATAVNAAPRNEAPAGLTESIVDLKVAEVQARSSAEVIQTADETLGSLIDVRV
ncbi:hypothetical protein SG34_001260 [Thalassomonas viridans]|uniref:Excinuclease ATPase subunit n=1 Tax=Thalassomonas viridans TaxID=137584 RepID=A0AAE9Z3G6_9GAMM|nr:hypothetical protein [Thalassomonas viridans]WDE05602.1 hypothetical protein SG34_001260 [Thalassomonas viridans]